MATKNNRWACVNCHNEFHRIVEEGFPDPKYCSQECREEQKDKYMKFMCKWCSKDFERPNRTKGTIPQFCSMSCSGKNSGTAKKGKPVGAHKYPDAVFEKRDDDKYYVSKRGMYTFKCGTCSNSFTKLIGYGSKKPYFCSLKCRRSIASLQLKLMEEETKLPLTKKDRGNNEKIPKENDRISPRLFLIEDQIQSLQTSVDLLYNKLIYCFFCLVGAAVIHTIDAAIRIFNFWS